MPHYEYRVIKGLIDNKYPSYFIGEVYFDKGIAISYSKLDQICSFPNPNLNISDTEAYKDLKEMVKDILLAFVKPLLDGDTLGELNEDKQDIGENISALS